MRLRNRVAGGCASRGRRTVGSGSGRRDGAALPDLDDFDLHVELAQPGRAGAVPEERRGHEGGVRASKLQTSKDMKKRGKRGRSTDPPGDGTVRGRGGEERGGGDVRYECGQFCQCQCQCRRSRVFIRRRLVDRREGAYLCAGAGAGRCIGVRSDGPAVSLPVPLGRGERRKRGMRSVPVSQFGFSLPALSVAVLDSPVFFFAPERENAGLPCVVDHQRWWLPTVAAEGTPTMNDVLLPRCGCCGIRD